MATEAGWYDDGTGKQRWWDGARWTEHYIDLTERSVELHADASQPGRAAAPGWYDDGRGRRRWWDGTRWTDAARFSGEEQSAAGVVVDGRWIHFGGSSQRVAGAVATIATGAELLRRGRLGGPAIARTLYGAAGPISPQMLKRSVIPEWTYLLVDVGGQVWLAGIPAVEEAEARRFATWVNTVSEHYRYRD